MNSDGNFKDVSHPIVGNDSSVKSITFFVNEITKAYEDGLAHPVVTASEKQPEKKEA